MGFLPACCAMNRSSGHTRNYKVHAFIAGLLLVCPSVFAGDGARVAVDLVPDKYTKTV